MTRKEGPKPAPYTFSPLPPQNVVNCAIESTSSGCFMAGFRHHEAECDGLRTVLILELENIRWPPLRVVVQEGTVRSASTHAGS